MGKASTVQEILEKTFALVHEAGTVLEADERTIRRGIAAGEIPAVRFGSSTRIPVTWLRQVAGLDEPGDAG